MTASIDGLDTLFGGGSRHSLFGGADNDSLYGGTENDSLDGGQGADLLYGGDGNDTLTGGTENDTLFGDAGNDSLSGDAGDDSLTGGDGADTIAGGIGNDAIYGGDGADQIDGGTGNDTIFFGAGDDTVYGGDGNDQIDDSNGDQLVGTNLIFGGQGSDTIWSGFGDDTVYGGTENDVLSGEGGNDLLSGDAGSDTVSGGDGADTVFGGAGSDALFGGADRDLFTINTASDGFGDNIDGGSTGDDFDRLDLTGTGKPLITYTTPNRENGFATFRDSAGHVIGTLTFSEIENVVPCFTPGTLIATPQGTTPIDSLRPGDLVLTRDGGPEPLCWVGRRALSRAAVAAWPCLAPVRIARGALGHGLPTRDMLVSPQHRVLIAGPKSTLCFGEAEVLVAALHLVGRPGITRAATAPVTYLHLMFDRHEIIRSDGAWTESFQPGELALGGMDAGQRAEIEALFPGAAARFPAARRSLKAHEARVLLAA